MGKQFTENQLTRMIERMDLNKPGKINYGEFLLGTGIKELSEIHETPGLVAT